MDLYTSAEEWEVGCNECCQEARNSTELVKYKIMDYHYTKLWLKTINVGVLKHISSTGNLNNTVSLNGNYKLSVKHYTKRALQSVNIPLVHLGMNIRCICIPRK